MSYATSMLHSSCNIGVANLHTLMQDLRCYITYTHRYVHGGDSRVAVINVDPGASEEDRKRTLEDRKRDLDALERDREAAQAEARKNRGFAQVYDPGWLRLQQLVRDNPSAARLYMWVAQHADGQGGTVVASQDLIAEELGIHRTTVWRLSKALETAKALVRIRVGPSVYAYGLNPHEVWRSWNTTKDTAVFVTKTLVRKKDRENATVDRKIRLMMHDRQGTAEDEGTTEPAAKAA